MLLLENFKLYIGLTLYFYFYWSRKGLPTSHASKNMFPCALVPGTLCKRALQMAFLTLLQKRVEDLCCNILVGTNATFSRRLVKRQRCYCESQLSLPAHPRTTPHRWAHLLTNQKCLYPFLASGNSYNVYVLVGLKLFLIHSRKVPLCCSIYAQLITQMLMW